MTYATCSIHSNLNGATLHIRAPVDGAAGNDYYVQVSTQAPGQPWSVRGLGLRTDLLVASNTDTKSTVAMVGLLNTSPACVCYAFDGTGGESWTDDDATLASGGDGSGLYQMSGGVDVNVGSAAGTSTVAATGVAKKPAVGASAGSASVTAVGKANTAGVGAAAGTAAVAGATGLNAGVGHATGTSTATGVGSASIGSAGSAQGAATVTGVTGLRQAVGLAQGTSAVVYNDPQPILAPVTSRVDHVQRAIDRLCQYAKEKRSVQ